MYGERSRQNVAFVSLPRRNIKATFIILHSDVSLDKTAFVGKIRLFSISTLKTLYFYYLFQNVSWKKFVILFTRILQNTGFKHITYSLMPTDLLLDSTK